MKFVGWYSFPFIRFKMAEVTYMIYEATCVQLQNP